MDALSHCPFNENKFEPPEVRRLKWDYARYEAKKKERAKQKSKGNCFFISM
jgi:hypothetical protein